MKALACLLAGVLAVSCGGRQEPNNVVEKSLQLPGSIALPKVKPAVAAFRVSLPRPAGAGILKRVKKADGVAAVAALALEKVTVTSPDRTNLLSVGAVKPLQYRPLAPQPTRDANFVWTSMLQGEAIVTPKAARALDVAGGARLIAGTEPIQIGAFADNGVPNLADILVAGHIGGDLKLGPPRVLVVGAGPKTDPTALRRRLQRALPPAARIRRIAPAPAPPPAPEPVGVAEGQIIGAMTYRIRKDGYIEPDPRWVAANIVNANVPILGSVTCHRLLIPQLAAALGEVERKGLAAKVDPARYGGCYVPRFIGRDPRRSLSLHAFGLAVDLNVSTNHYGTRGDMDPRVVAIFSKWGFAWGGSWSTPDPMHFQLARLINL